MSAKIEPPVSGPAVVARGDFPTWLPPVFVKELRQGLHTRGFVAAFIVFQVVMVLMMIGSIAGMPNATPAARAQSMASTNALFWGVIGVVLLAVTPGRALAGLKTEIDTRTLDLLVLTRLTAWRVVLGKWASLVSQAVLLIIAMLPYGIVRYFAGSVDLASDFYTILIMLGVSAVVTAASLWASGLPKVLGILLVILAVYFQGMGGLTLLSSRGALSGFNPGAVGWTLIIVDACIVMTYFFVAAVRRIAPPAENHAPLARILALMSLIPVPISAGLGRLPVARDQFYFAVGFSILVSAVELAVMRRAMAVQWKAFSRRGLIGRWAGHFLLPGSASALNFVTVLSLLVLGIIYTPGLFAESDRSFFGWLLMLAYGGLLFPVAVMSFRKAAARGAAFYGLLLGVLSIPGVIAVGMSGPFLRPWLANLISLIPVANYYVILGRAREQPLWIVVAQVSVVVATLVILRLRGREYWNQIRAFEDADTVGRKIAER